MPKLFLSRFFVDYERELTVVAERPSKDESRMIGLGRLAAAPGDGVGHCALLVADGWQEKGLGAKLTAFFLDIAGRWGLRQIDAVSDPGDEATSATLRTHCMVSAAWRFKSITGASSPPTINSVGTRTFGRASLARSGRPPRETTAPIRSGRSLAAISAAAAPVLDPNNPKGNSSVG